MVYQVPHFINGKSVSGGERKLNIFNPAKGEAIGELQVANATIINQAVDAALLAFDKWSKVSVPHRARILFRLKALLDDEKQNLAKLINQEHGKTIDEALGSIQRGIDVVDYVCGIPSHLKGEFAEKVASGVDCYSLRQPLGVCVGITPFNFPAMIPLWMFPMAIACGNTFILKPSEKDPSCAIKLMEIAKAAGVPDGVVNVVQGDKDTVTALIEHPGIKAISFVGSTPAAEAVYQMGTARNKRVQAFGGAKNHCLLMPDADIHEAVKAITNAAYGSAGERCMAISVVIAVGDEIADQLIKQLKPAVEQLVIGPGWESDIDMGPLVTKEHFERVQSYIELGQNEGARLLLDGRSYQHPHYPQGFFMGPSLFDDVKPNMRIYREEIFGPVLCVLRVPDFDTGIKLINDHEYGNGTCIFTRDGYYARVFAEAVQVGMVGVNVPVPVPVAYQSFGGWKRSVFSDIGMYGPEAIRFYTKLKTVTTRWFSGEIA